MPYGQCTLPPDESGRILDRLAGLEQVIPAETIRQALTATGRVNPRRCKLTHEVVCWVVLAMGILTDLPIRQVFKHARRLRFGETTPHRSSLCVARRRLGIAPVRRLFEEVVHPLARPETPGAFYHGLRLVGLDGTVLDVPDSQANAAAFGTSLGRAARRRRVPSDPQAQPGRVGDPRRIRLRRPARSLTASSRWSTACSAI